MRHNMNKKQGMGLEKKDGKEKKGRVRGTNKGEGGGKRDERGRNGRSGEE